MEPLPGLPWPVRRSRHAACCLNYGEDHPKVLLSGGLNEYNSVLGDLWIVDINSGKWTEVRMMAATSSVNKTVYCNPTFGLFFLYKCLVVTCR